MNEAFPRLEDLVQAIEENAKQEDREDYYHSILCTYIQENKKPTILNTVGGGFVHYGKEANDLRGRAYQLMSFDERFEFMKKITRQNKLSVRGFERFHTWMLDSHEDTISFSSDTDTSHRLRSVTITAELDSSNKYECTVKLSSSPRGQYLSSRFRQKFGVDSTVNISFSFPRMGIHSQLYLHEQEADEFTMVDLNQSQQQALKRYYQVIDRINGKEVEIDKNNGHFHKLRIQSEILSFNRIKEYLEKDFNICGCKFSVLCQNMSGMHSYKYTYFCPQLSVITTSLENVKSWAVPIKENLELYASEKKLKLFLRLSLFNTPTFKTIKVTQFKIKDDIGDCTDGCGFISPEYAEEITQCIRGYSSSVRKSHINENNQYESDGMDLDVEGIELIESLPQNYTPSAFQVRFMGAKGMLCVKNDLVSEHGCHLVLHQSMVKIIHNKTEDDILQTIHIVGFSKPSQNARANIPIIHMLNGASDSSGIVQQKLMQAHEQVVDNALSLYLNHSTKELLELYVQENDFAALATLVMEKDAKLAFLAGPFRTHLLPMKIPLADSRRLYGIADPYGVLGPKEVFVNVSGVGILRGTILITKEPCFHRGDLRKVPCANYEKLHHLVDVIVFPTTCKRPIPNMIAGSDLDGDEYVVCWDQDMVQHCQTFQAGEFDTSDDRESFRKDKSFEPDVFKYWVGIRMAYADFYDKDWTRDDNWNQTMSILSDVLNSAIDAPKSGNITRARKDILVDLVKNFPGYPHYSNKERTRAIHSQSILGRIFDRMIEKVTTALNYSNSQLTGMDYQKELAMLLMSFIGRNDFLVLGVGELMLNFVSDTKDGDHSVMMVSEFLRQFWRCLGYGHLNDDDDWYYCMLKQKMTSISQEALNNITKIAIEDSSKLIVTYNIDPMTSLDPFPEEEVEGVEFETIFCDESCNIFKISINDDETNLMGYSDLMEDALKRIGVADFILCKDSAFKNCFNSLKEQSLTVLNEITQPYYDQQLSSRFDFVGLCGFGNVRQELERDRLEHYTNTMNSYLATCDLSGIKKLTLTRQDHSTIDGLLDNFNAGSVVELFKKESDQLNIQIPYTGPQRCLALTCNICVSNLTSLCMTFNKIGNEGVNIFHREGLTI